MRLLLFVLTAFSSATFAECIWSQQKPIVNFKSMTVSQCKTESKLKIDDELELLVNFELEIANDCPECNYVWAKPSPDKKLVFVYVENSNFQRNGWLIDRTSGNLLLFVDDSTPKGRHYLVKFVSNTELKIKHAGIGYKVEEHYTLSKGVWQKQVTDGAKRRREHDRN